MLTPEDARRRWRGAFVPLASIFAQDGSLDLEATAAHVRWLIDRGARQGNTILLAGGSGADFPMLSLEEREATIRATAQVAAGRVPIIAGVQSTDVRETIELCQLCEDLGIDGVQISGPYYYDGRPDDVVAWFREVARHTGVGFVVYNNWYTGYNMPMDLIDRLLEIPNSIGAKWSSPDVHTFYNGIRRWLPRVAVIDNSLLPVMPHILGCRAFTANVPNFYPEHSWRVWDLMEQGEYREAQRVFDEFMVPFFDVIRQIGIATAGEAVYVRAAMAAAGLRAGSSRLPSRDEAVTPEMREALRRLVARVGAAT